MDRKENIRNAYRLTGSNNFYDGMVTCSTVSGCFSAPILWVAHACISGLFIVLLHIFHVTGFTTNLLGSVLMNLSAGAHHRPH